MAIRGEVCENSTRMVQGLRGSRKLKALMNDLKTWSKQFLVIFGVRKSKMLADIHNLDMKGEKGCLKRSSLQWKSLNQN